MAKQKKSAGRGLLVFYDNSAVTQMNRCSEHLAIHACAFIIKQMPKCFCSNSNCLIAQIYNTINTPLLQVLWGFPRRFSYFTVSCTVRCVHCSLCTQRE